MLYSLFVEQSCWCCTIYKEINCCHTVTLFFNAVFIVCWAVKLVLYNLQRNKLMLSHALSREPQDNSILLREYWFERTIDKFNGFKETIVIFNGFEETIVNFQWFLRRPSPLNVFWQSDHCHQWFFDGFLIFLPSLSMVFDGSGPLVQRCDGFDGSSWCESESESITSFLWSFAISNSP